MNLLCFISEKKRNLPAGIFATGNLKSQPPRPAVNQPLA